MHFIEAPMATSSPEIRTEYLKLLCSRIIKGKNPMYIPIFPQFAKNPETKTAVRTFALDFRIKHDLHLMETYG